MTTWDQKHDQEAKCLRCGHTYYRHFDSYEGMSPVGCKYCRCPNFVEPDGSYIVETPLRDALARAQREASEYDDEGDSPSSRCSGNSRSVGKRPAPPPLPSPAPITGRRPPRAAPASRTATA